MNKKKIFAVVVAAVVLVSVALAGTLAFAKPAQGLPADSAANRTVSVSGNAQVTLKPDMATIDFGVQTTNAATVAAGRDANNVLMTKVMDALKAQGVDTDKDVKTVNYSINPRYGADGKQVTGYDIVNSVEVTVRNLDNLGAAMDAVATAGANTISGLSFGVADYSAAYNQALEKAIANAKARAETLAKKAGATLGTVVSASEGGYYPPSPIYYSRNMADKGGVAPVSPGSLQVSASVSVIYALN
jgi:uncharacterized protein